jgi:Uma2 family endonuclease
MLIGERLYTVGEFIEFANLPENEARRFELDTGAIVEMSSSRQQNTVIAGRVIYFLNAFVIPRSLGFVTVPDGGFRLAPRTVRMPDAAFISKARHPLLDGVEFPVAPDLAVEVVSPDEDIHKKAYEYFRAGTKIVWAIYPDERRVYVMRLDEDGGLKSIPQEDDALLDGGDVLPGFTLAVQDVFPVNE